jgi:hypothetical protein
MLDRCLRSATSPSDLPRHKLFSASARIEVYSHLATSKLSSSSPQCRRTSPVAFFSTASNVYHARPSCTPTQSPPELTELEYRHALHAVALHAAQLLLLFLLLDTRSLRPRRVTSAHV